MSATSFSRMTPFLRNLRAALSPRAYAAQTNRLAVDGLVDDWTTFMPGCVYVIYAASHSAESDALLWQSARQAGSRDVTLVLARDPDTVATQLRARQFNDRSRVPGWPEGLNVFAMPEPALPPSEHAAPLAALLGGLRALKPFGFPRHALYMVEGAQRWFSRSDAAALNREARFFAHWCRVRALTFVLLFDSADSESIAPAGSIHGDTTATQHVLHSLCAGVAHIVNVRGELQWRIDHWRTPQGLITGELRKLRFSDNGRLVASVITHDAQHGADTMVAPDERRVLATRAVVAPEKTPPPHWEVHDNQSAVLAACVGARAATVILDYVSHRHLETLCAAVHQLRRRCGPALKICVIERDQALRHQYELLLLNIGANAVFGRNIPFPKFLTRIEALQGQMYTRPLIEYRAAMAAALNVSMRGYVPVAGFCAQVRDVLARTTLLGIPHMLAKLTLLPERAHVDVVRACVPRRAGDVFTADAAHLYVFLFSCRMADADTALARVFSVPAETVSDRIAYVAEHGIADELNALQSLIERTPVPDYSYLFAKQATEQTTEQAAGPTREHDAVESAPIAATPANTANETLAQDEPDDTESPGPHRTSKQVRRVESVRMPLRPGTCS